MRLDNTKIQRWKDLVDAFIKSHKYNMDISPDRSGLSFLEKRDKKKLYMNTVNNGEIWLRMCIPHF